MRSLLWKCASDSENQVIRCKSTTDRKSGEVDEAGAVVCVLAGVCLSKVSVERQTVALPQSGAADSAGFQSLDLFLWKKVSRLVLTAGNACRDTHVCCICTASYTNILSLTRNNSVLQVYYMPTVKTFMVVKGLLLLWMLI